MVSNPTLQVVDKDLAWACKVLDKDLHSSRQGPRQGLTPEPAASYIGKASNPSLQVMGNVLSWARMVLG